MGNVRAVVDKNGVIKSFADYYPFGEQLPNRNSNSGNYRYAFQGQELDPETGMEAFQLRLWDGRLGRWMSPDPYGQHSSPYLGMGNNPVNRVDPDGGADGDPIKFPSDPCSGDSFTTADGGNWSYNGESWDPQGFNLQTLSEIVVGGKKGMQQANLGITGAIPAAYYLDGIFGGSLGSGLGTGTFTVSAEVLWPITLVGAAIGFGYFAANLGTPYKPTYAEAEASGTISCTAGSAAYNPNYPGEWTYTYEDP